MSSASRAAIGFSVKSGWAAAVLVSGTAKSPHVIDSRRIELSDPSVPDSRQPYHAGFGTARASGPGLTRLVAGVRRFGRQSVSAIIDQYRTAGHDLVGAGIVVGSLIDPERIANAHIQIHAREGQLFRGVVEDAARAVSLSCSVWRERDLYSTAALTLKHPEESLRSTVKSLRKEVPGPWRAEQQAATVAAWLMLIGSARDATAPRRVKRT